MQSRFQPAVRVSAIYALFGVTWIAVSDRVLAVLVRDPEVLTRIQTIKGWAFVAASTVLLFLAVRLELKRRRATEESLLESRALLQSVVEGTSDAVYAKDRVGRYLMINEAALRAVGRSRDQVLGFDDYALFPPDDAAVVMEGDRRVMAEGRTQTYEEHLTAADGEKRCFYSTKGPIRAQDGAVVGLFGIARDITDRKRSEAEKLQLERQILHAQKLESLGVLAGGIAHDFNNILMAVLGRADLALLSLPPGSAERAHVQEMEKAALRASELVRQMLDYSGKGRFVTEEIRLNELVEEMGRLLDVSASKSTTLRYELGKDLPPVEGDPAQLRQVVMNLITNASEALGERAGVVRLSTGVLHCSAADLAADNPAFRAGADGALPGGRYVYVEVSDDGPGMDRLTLQRIFDPFFTTKFAGRGLGLAAVLGIVRGHRGALKVLSEVGRGTTFRVLLPAAEPRGEPAPASRDPAEGTGWLGRGLVLLADDEEAVRAVGRAMLLKLGFEVITAGDGAEAVELFRQRADEVACVLLDLTMPRLSGEEALRELRQIRPEVPVILSSGYSEQRAAEHFGVRPKGFLQKPYNLKDLEATVREALDGC